MDTVVWLGLIVLFLLIEAGTVTMVSLWFCIGGLAALVLSLFGCALWIQITVFLVVSGIMLACLRPVCHKYFTPRLSRTNVDSVVGQQCYVTSSIDNLTSSGQIRLNGIEWSARSVSGEPIAQGTLVRIQRVEGVKVFVSPTVPTAPETN